jgi:hypothetical protein
MSAWDSGTIRSVASRGAAPRAETAVGGTLSRSEAQRQYRAFIREFTDPDMGGYVYRCDIVWSGGLLSREFKEACSSCVCAREA